MSAHAVTSNLVETRRRSGGVTADQGKRSQWGTTEMTSPMGGSCCGLRPPASVVWMVESPDGDRWFGDTSGGRRFRTVRRVQGFVRVYRLRHDPSDEEMLGKIRGAKAEAEARGLTLIDQPRLFLDL